MLETHHKKLAEILRFQHEHPASALTDTSSAPSSTLAQQAAEFGNTKNAIATQDAHNLPPRLVGNARLPSRETSSIASNLASARGIPSHPRGIPVSPTLTSQHAAAKMTDTTQRAKSGEARLRDGSNKNRTNRAEFRQPWSPPTPTSAEVTVQKTVPPSTAESRDTKDKPALTDEAFNRFYSAFGGLVSKVSGPLAFAGIQVGAGDAEQNRKASAEVKLDRDHATLDRSITTGEPDVNRIFSRAALRSLRDGSGASGNPAESFYVVPTTGGTMSYAGILTRAEKQARRNSLEDAEDDFVDARETPSSPEMRHSGSSSRIWAGRRGAPDKLTSPQKQKTMEEMQMENETLRNLTDSLATRLHMWEVSAQNSSMALQQSIRMMHRQTGGTPDYFQPPTATTSPVATLTAPPAADHDARIKELEEQIRRSEQKLENASHENDKLKNVLGRYRDRWEKLKEGAKTRRAEARSGDSQSNPASGTSKQPDQSASPGPTQSPSLGQPGP